MLVHIGRLHRGQVARGTGRNGESILVPLLSWVRAQGQLADPNESYVVGLVNLCLLDEGLTWYLAHSG